MKAYSGVELILNGLVCAVSLSLFLTSSRAESGGTCVPASSRIAQDKIDTFIQNPEVLLSGSTQTGGKLVADVRNLALSGGAATAAISKVMKAASAEQAGSIGAGLGEAALLCRKTSPEVARQIQELVIGAEQTVILASFESIIQEQVTAAVDDGVAADQSLDVIGDSVSGGDKFVTRPTPSAGGAVPPITFFGIHSTGGGGGTSTPTTTTFRTTSTTNPALNSVSPSR